MTEITAKLSTALADRYRIESHLGEGGMATVYLAEDLKHKRKVAVKVLRPELAAVLGAERFVQEITTTANLQHPHILPLFDSGEADGFLFYVMPFIDGETLREKLDRETQFGIDEAVKIAVDVADALHTAHQQGVIHRDIKPENILLQNGRPMVADFGIALAVSAAAGGRMTETGLSLGTPHYMSPEQATAEKDLSARSDIYSLGSVLYEMLAGAPPHLGGSAQQIIMKIVTEEATHVTNMRKSVPPNVAAAVAQALEKLPADRFASAADFARALQDPGFGPAAGASAAGSVPDARSRAKQAVPWAIAAAAAIVSVVTLARGSGGEDGAPGSVVFASLDVQGAGMRSRSGAALSLSPDGRHVAITVQREDGSGLGVRSLDSTHIRFLRQTRDARFPFWSPDARSIGFFADDSLKVVNVTSGLVRALCRVVTTQGGTWASDGTILFGTSNHEIVRTSSAGGTCEALPLRVESGNPDGRFRPYFFGDGRHFVAATWRDVWLGELGTDSLVKLGDLIGSMAVLLPPHYLLFRGADGVLVQRIDVAQRRLVGEPTRMLSRVSGGGGFPAVSAASDALVVIFRSDDERGPPDVWIDRSGADLTSRGSSRGAFGGSRLSRDGTRLAEGGFGIAAQAEGGEWGYVAGAASSPFLHYFPLWAPGDTAIMFVVLSTPPTIHTVGLRSGQDRIVAELPVRGLPATAPWARLADWSPDGKVIAFMSEGGNADPWDSPVGAEAWEYDLAADSAYRLFEVTGEVVQLRYAPNGRWILYQVVSAGVSNVFLRPYPGPGDPVLVSPAGGRSPRWRGDSEELFYVAQDGEAVMSRTVGPGSPVRLGPPELALASGTLAPSHIANFGDVAGFEVSPDGQRFHFDLESEVPKLSLVLNWRSLLERPQ
jgi:tRNA A-37 threonylcarbamoyl transferase component Bud32